MRLRLVAFAFLVGLVASSCGARLTEEQRAIAIGALSAGRAAATEDVAGKGEVSIGGPGAGTVSGAGTAIAGGGAAAAGATGETAPQAPAAGNGGATDVGVTGSTIVVATVSDISGVQPGLFKATHQAIQAWAAYQNSLGGLYGRQVKPLLIDDQTNSGGNRASTLDACQKSFALVGSMSAFDDGGAEAVDKCGIPDVSAIVVNPPRAFAKSTYPAFPNRPDYYIIGAPTYIKEQHPEAIKKAAILYLDAGVTRINGVQRRKALEKIGYEFVYEQAVQLFETNYSSHVVRMQQAGVQYITMVSDYQNIYRLLRDMRKQGWRPEVIDWDSVVYSPGFLQLSQGVADGSLFSLTTGMFEEVSKNPEMQLYIQWLQRVAPGAQPDFFGLYAWSAGRLFSKVAEAVGPRLTRKAFFVELKKVRSWDANGLHAAHDIGGKRASPCFLYAEVRNNKFVRHAPASGFFCDKGPVVPNPID